MKWLRERFASQESKLPVWLITLTLATTCGCGETAPQTAMPSGQDEGQATPRETAAEIGLNPSPGEPRRLPAPLAAPQDSPLNSQAESAHFAGNGLLTLGKVEPLTVEPELTVPESSQAQPLFEKLSQPGLDEEEWVSAQTQLLELGDAAVPCLVRNLQKGDDFQREQAATLLAQLGPSAGPAATALRTALNDSSAYVRVNAAVALMQLPGQLPSATQALLELLRHPDEQLRQMAAVNLSAIGPEAVTHLDELTAVLRPGESTEVLLPVVQLLGKIGPPAQSALPHLKRIEVGQADIAEATRAAIQLISSESPATE